MRLYKNLYVQALEHANNILRFRPSTIEQAVSFVAVRHNIPKSVLMKHFDNKGVK